jgi:hypothetical protein
MILGLSEVSDVDFRSYQQRKIDPIETPWYKGLASAIPMGIEHAFAVAGTSSDEDMDARTKKIRATRPDPVKMGTAAQILHGFSSVAAYGAIGAGGGATTGAAIGGVGGAVVGGVGAIPGAVAGAAFGAKTGAAASIGYLSAVDRYFELVEQGVDHDTASKSAGVTGIVMSAGAVAPAFVGKTLAGQVASGVGINVGLGMVERGVTEQLLEDKYAKVAEHYKAIDRQSIVLDAMLGAAFPLGGRFLGRMMKQEELDSALVAQQDTTAQTRNPGLESSIENVETFKANLSEADKQILTEGKTTSEVSLPRTTADIPNPEFGRMMETFDEAIATQTARDFGVSRDVMESDLRTALELDTEVRNSVQERIAREIDTREPDVAGKVAEDVTPDMFAKQEAELIAKTNPDVKVATADGKEIGAEGLGKYIDDVVRQGKEDTFLHNVAIACYLTHGE